MKFTSLLRRAAAIAVAATLSVTLSASPASADDHPNDYDVICCTYSAAGTITTDSQGNRYGSDTLQKQYQYLSLDTNGNMFLYTLTIKGNYAWKHIVDDGQMLIKTKWEYGSLRRSSIAQSSAYAGIVAHNSNAQSRLYPYLSGSSNNVYQSPLDWSGAAVTNHQHVWLSFPYQNSDTRWLRTTGKWTIKLPPGEKFNQCETPNANGKNIFTFTTTMSYQR